MRDYQESVTTGQTRTDGQTDAGQSDPYVPLCFAGDSIKDPGAERVSLREQVMIKTARLSFLKDKRYFITCVKLYRAEFTKYTLHTNWKTNWFNNSNLTLSTLQKIVKRNINVLFFLDKTLFERSIIQNENWSNTKQSCRFPLLPTNLRLAIV